MPIASLVPNNEQPDYAAEVMARLSKDYAHLLESVADILDRMRKLPPIKDEDDLAKYGAILTEARDHRKRLDAYHDAEKAPYLRGGQGCDQWFFGQIGKLGRRNPKEPAGGIDVCEARVDDFMQKKLQAEREAREAIAAEEERKAEVIRKREEDALRAAQEASAKAARARNAETIAAHQKEAARLAEIADKARRESVVAEQQAEDARTDTKAAPADMVRTRLSSGALATVAQVPVVEIIDVTLLNKDRLWPHLKEEHILMALKAWAKTQSHKTPMAGALIKMRDKGKIQ